MNLPSTVTTLSVFPKPLLQTSILQESVSLKETIEKQEQAAVSEDHAEEANVESTEGKVASGQIEAITGK